MQHKVIQICIQMISPILKHTDNMLMLAGPGFSNLPPLTCVFTFKHSTYLFMFSVILFYRQIQIKCKQLTAQ